MAAFHNSPEPANTEWMFNAACKGLDPDFFYPSDEEEAQKALKVCAACAVRAECLEFAFITDQRYGIWGGIRETERNKLRKDWLRSQAS